VFKFKRRVTPEAGFLGSDERGSLRVLEGRLNRANKAEFCSKIPKAQIDRRHVVDSTNSSDWTSAKNQT